MLLQFQVGSRGESIIRGISCDCREDGELRCIHIKPEVMKMVNAGRKDAHWSNHLYDVLSEAMTIDSSGRPLTVRGRP